MEDLDGLHGSEILVGGQIDVATSREHARRRRVGRLAILLWLLVGWMALRLAWGLAFLPRLNIPQELVPSFLIVGMLASVLVVPMWAGAVLRTSSIARPTSTSASTTSWGPTSSAKRSSEPSTCSSPTRPCATGWARPRCEAFCSKGHPAPARRTALRDALLERGELVGDEIRDVIRAAILREELTDIDLRGQAVDRR